MSRIWRLLSKVDSRNRSGSLAGRWEINMPRLALLPILHHKGAYSKVVRDAHEIVELALKGMLRQVWIEPPKWHDVGSLLVRHAHRFETKVSERIRDLAEAL